MSFILGKIGGSSNKTDRRTQFEGWSDLRKVFDWANPFGQKTAEQGVGDLNTAGDFYKSILGGDRAKIGQVLAPEISNIQGQVSQHNKTLSEFGNRSGGTNAGMQAGETAGSTQIQQLIDSLLPASASGLTQVGSTLGGLGLSAVNMASNAGATISGQAGADRGLAVQEQMAKGQAELQMLLALFTPTSGGGGAGGRPSCCWVAAELFGGWWEPRTVLVRDWLTGPFSDNWLGGRIMRVYGRHGENLAALVRRRKIARWFFWPIFGTALWFARRRAARDERVNSVATERVG